MIGSYGFPCFGFLHATLARLTRTTLLAALCRSFALTSSLWAFVMSPTARFREYAILLNFAIKALERLLERIAGVDLDLTHGNYQRDLLSLLRPDFFG